MPVRGCFLILVAVNAWSAAHAQPSPEGAECAPVIAAVRTIGAAPHYYSVMTVTSPARSRPVKREQVVIDDTIYATSTSGGRWMKLTLSRADRDELSAGLVRYPPHDCSVSRRTMDGDAMQVYAYQQDVSGPGSAASLVWVDRKGLPRMIESQEGSLRIVITFKYDNVSPPEFH